MKDILLTFQEFEFVEFEKVFQSILYFCHIDPLTINEDETNKLEWKKGKKRWNEIFPYIISYEPLGPKPEECRGIFKLNRIKDNLETVLPKKDEIKNYSWSLYQLIDYLLLIIKIRYDDINERYNKVLKYKEDREAIIKANQEIDDERNKIIEEAKALHPEIIVPGEEVKEEEKNEGEEGEEKKEGEEGEEKKDEEKKEDDKKEKKKEDKKEDKKDDKKKDDKKEGEEEEEDPQKKLEDDLKKYDEEHPKQEVPPDMDFDLDNDYDIERK